MSDHQVTLSRCRMIDFTYNSDTDIFTGTTPFGTYVAEPTGRCEHRETDHPHKNTVVYRLGFRPARGGDMVVLGEGREAAFTMLAVIHHLELANREEAE
jgi:hypothetical protein